MCWKKNGVENAQLDTFCNTSGRQRRSRWSAGDRSTLVFRLIKYNYSRSVVHYYTIERVTSNIMVFSDMSSGVEQRGGGVTGHSNEPLTPPPLPTTFETWTNLHERSLYAGNEANSVNKTLFCYLWRDHFSAVTSTNFNCCCKIQCMFNRVFYLQPTALFL